MKTSFEKQRMGLVLSSISIAMIAISFILLMFIHTKPAKSEAFANSNALNPTLEPGLVITGHVRSYTENGAGLEQVSIYRSYAAYPGDQIAETDLQGYYDSGYYFIPGYELVTVWAAKEGYNLEPQQYNWAHYSGYEIRELNFVATPLLTDCTMPPLPNRILVDRGSWNTSELQHSVYILLGQGAKAITVTNEAGIVIETGALPSSLSITVPLLPNTLHHLKVDVKFEQENGCFYQTSTSYDLWGFPLLINQEMSHKHYLPLVLMTK